MRVKIQQQFKILRAEVVEKPTRDDKIVLDVFLKGETREVTDAQIAWLKERGMGDYVLPLSEVTDPAVDDSGLDGDLSSMTVRELKAVAQNKGIDVTGLTKKADLVAAIEGGDEEGDGAADAGPIEAP